MDFRDRARPNFSPNIGLETRSTGSVECLVRLQAEAAADDLLHDLGGAAEDRLHAVKPPELTIVAESSGLVRRSAPGLGHAGPGPWLGTRP